MNEQTKFVDYPTYCPKCVHHSKKDIEDPCNECLTEPTNGHSRKPVKFEENSTQTSREKHSH